MLETFVASAHFKALLHRHQDIPAVQKYNLFLDIAAKDKSRDPLAGVLSPPDIFHPGTSVSPGEPLSPRALAALASYYADYFPNQGLPSFTSYSKHTLGKVTFATYISSPRDCNISFTSNNIQKPGIIRFIVAAEQLPQHVLFIVERYAPPPTNSVWNPFTSHAAYGASLWSGKMEDNLEVVPARNLQCHTILSRWSSGIYVIKALNRSS